jgi:hypothetical protein
MIATPNALLFQLQLKHVAINAQYVSVRKEEIQRAGK